ncbi:MAG: hypothetical protein M1600_01925 [Firmicutes bacterium]|jgi:hypothetical protein|nr:hypothetical protein [Bacillota bacterium]
MDFFPHFHQEVRVSGLDKGACPKFYLLVDSTDAGPLAFAGTKASILLAPLAKRHPLALKAARVLAGDQGYGSGPLGTELRDAYRMNPVIEIRNLWKDGEIRHGRPGYDYITYDYQGVVECDDPGTGIKRTMANEGLKSDRFTQKKGVPGGRLRGVSKGSEEGPVKHRLRIE